MSTLKRRISWSVYLILGLVFTGALALARSLPSESLLSLVGGSVGVVALLGVLLQLVRDEAAFQKALQLQEHQHKFDLGATSHMATVAFDKHVAFCEEYLQEVNSTVNTLFREGPAQDALTHAGDLYRIRLKYSAWLTADIEKQLEPFEQALRAIGSGAHMYAIDPRNANSSGAVDRMFDKFSDVLSLGKEEGKLVDPEVAVSTVLSRLREILGTGQLTTLRAELIRTVTLRGA